MTSVNFYPNSSLSHDGTQPLLGSEAQEHVDYLADNILTDIRCFITIVISDLMVPGVGSRRQGH